jgi:hypothetical protein
MAANPVPDSGRVGARCALDAQLGLFRMDELRLSTGHTCDGATIPQALWYFAEETIATPLAGVAVAGFRRGVSAWDDLREWASTHALDAKLAAPPLVWVGAPDIARGAELSPDGGSLAASGERWRFERVPKIPLNRSYYDATSTAYLAGRPLAVRGCARDGTFVARTLWPEEFRLDPAAPSRAVDPTPGALRALVREEPHGGARSPFAATALWERRPGAARRWVNAPVLALILNGAQGDDDEAHAGHFALVTGYVGPDGAIGDWITNNFYTLDAESEKGILPAMVPLDGYLGDLNSGQAWYRPSYLLVAVLGRERTASRLQGALQRTYNQFYRHQLAYRHTTMNCASISVDVLRLLGLDVPPRGATSWPAAALGLPYFALHDRSLAKAAQTFDYLTEDRTRLLPAAAFEEVGARLLQLARRKSSARSAFEAALAEDLEAIVYLSVPQLPSSRAWGDFPVASAWEYRRRYPRDPAKANIIPVPERPFPDALRDADLLPPPRRRSDVAIAIWAIVSVVGIPWLLWRRWRRTDGAKATATRSAAAVGSRAPRRGDAPTPQ